MIKNVCLCLCLLLLSVTTQVQGEDDIIKFGVISDIHLRKYYDPLRGDNWCVAPSEDVSLMNRFSNYMTSLVG